MIKRAINISSLASCSSRSSEAFMTSWCIHGIMISSGEIYCHVELCYTFECNTCCNLSRKTPAHRLLYIYLQRPKCEDLLANMLFRCHRLANGCAVSLALMALPAFLGSLIEASYQFGNWSDWSSLRSRDFRQTNAPRSSFRFNQQAQYNTSPIVWRTLQGPSTFGSEWCH